MDLKLNFEDLSNILKEITDEEKYLIIGFISGLVSKKVLQKYENKEANSNTELGE